MTLSHGSRESRGHYRKEVALFGGYIKAESELMGDMMVKDLSFTGLSFMTMSPHALKEGDRLRLSFRLDDPNLTEIVKNARVVHVQGRKVGVEFLRSAALDKDLGFYLLV